jgi:membrane fusion protein (multidrug efflux system)
MVQPGVTLMTIVGQAQPVITANFKETQIGRMHEGQAAQVKIDALPGVIFTGHVESLAPGSGAQFALIPFEPGSGNFTKIVQRVPVRIALRSEPGLDRLRRIVAEVRGEVELTRETAMAGASQPGRLGRQAQRHGAITPARLRWLACCSFAPFRRSGSH